MFAPSEGERRAKLALPSLTQLFCRRVWLVPLSTNKLYHFRSPSFIDSRLKRYNWSRLNFCCTSDGAFKGAPRWCSPLTTNTSSCCNKKFTSLQSSHENAHKSCLADDKHTTADIENLVYSTTTIVASWGKLIHKLYIATDFYFYSTTPAGCALDTGTGLNLINARFAHGAWTTCNKNSSLLRLRSATKISSTLHGNMLVHLQASDPVSRVWLGIVLDFSFTLLLEASFIICLICGIFSRKQK